MLNAVKYKGRSRSLDFTPDSDIILSGARELELMEAQRIRDGKFTG